MKYVRPYAESEPDEDSASNPPTTSTDSSPQKPYSSYLSPSQIKSLYRLTGHAGIYEKQMRDTLPETLSDIEKAELMTLLVASCTGDSAITFKDDSDALETLRKHLNVKNPEDVDESGEECLWSASCQADDLIETLERRVRKRNLILGGTAVAALTTIAAGFSLYKRWRSHDE
jgi:hypothetical protein